MKLRRYKKRLKRNTQTVTFFSHRTRARGWRLRKDGFTKQQHANAVCGKFAVGGYRTGHTACQKYVPGNTGSGNGKKCEVVMFTQSISSLLHKNTTIDISFLVHLNIYLLLKVYLRLTELRTWKVTRIDGKKSCRAKGYFYQLLK